MENLISSHYFHLPSQGNIYTMTNLKVANGPNKLLVATLKREIFCLEYQESSGAIIPLSKEVSFTYIPSAAEIISIDAFNKSSIKNEFVIGITIIKNNNNLDSLEYYLNIYSEWEETSDFNIENIAQNCLTLELNFVPYQLTHTDVVIWENDEIVTKEIVFILSGNDNQFHVYREHTADHLYKEVENKDFFPECLKTPSPIVWIDFDYNKDYSEDVLTYGLSKYTCLPRTDYACVSTCCLIIDIDFDGEDEILISNSAEEIILYKNDPELGWCLDEIKLFPSPLIKIMMIDIMGDGVKELVALSMKGIHFLQYDFATFPRILSKRLEKTNVDKIYEKLCISRDELSINK